LVCPRPENASVLLVNKNSRDTTAMGTKQSVPPSTKQSVPPPHDVGNYLLRRKFGEDEDAWSEHDVLLDGKSIADYQDGSRPWKKAYRAWRKGKIMPEFVRLASPAAGGRGTHARHAFWQAENSWP
jgi:hypothetical protein